MGGEMHRPMMPHGDNREAGLGVVEVTHWQTGWAVVGHAVLDVGLPRIPWAMTPGGVGVLLGLLDETRNIPIYYYDSKTEQILQNYSICVFMSRFWLQHAAVKTNVPVCVGNR